MCAGSPAKPMSNVLSGVQLSKTLPPAKSFEVVGSNGWCSAAGYPDWLYKYSELVYFHVPTTSLWRRNGKTLARVDAYHSAICGFISRTPDVLARAVFSSWQSIAASARRWRAADVLCISDEASRPVARTAPRGLRKSFRGVSPPPSDGWVRGARGWEAHAAAQNWVRKAVEAEEATEAAAHGAAYIYFYVPTQSLWMELPNGTFACIETYHSAVAAFIVASGGALLRTVFFTWCSQARVVRQWRSRINVMSSSFGEQESEEILGSGSTAEAAEAAWSVKTAFLSSRRRLRER